MLQNQANGVGLAFPLSLLTSAWAKMCAEFHGQVHNLTSPQSEGMSSQMLNFVESMLIQFSDEFQQNPRLVKTMAEVCFRFRRENENEAADSLSSYLAWRQSTFGDLEDQCMAENSKLREQLQTNILRLSPKRLSNGAALVFMSMKDHNPSVYSTTDTIKCMHYFMIAAMTVDPDIARDGFVFVNDMSNVEYQNLDLNFPAAISPALGKSLPLRLNSIVITNAPMFLRIIVPVLKAVLPAKLLDRLFVTEDGSLPEQLGIPQGDLPVELDGMIAMDPEYDLQQLLVRRWCV
jgi:hypothetical protein